VTTPGSGHATGAVLAAGAGARFGATKQLAPLDGRPLVAHVVATACAAGLDPVHVVVGHDAERVAAAVPGAVVVDNAAAADGQATSLAAAVTAATGTDATVLVVLLADEPGVTTTAIAAVVAAQAGGATVARAVYDDRPGHPVAFDRSVWAQLLEVTGDRGAQQLFDRLPVTPVRVAGPAPTDIDTPADLTALRDRRDRRDRRD